MGAFNTFMNIGAGVYDSRQADKRQASSAGLAARDLEARADRKELEAREALRQGELDVAEHRAESRLEASRLTASYAGSGVKVNEGSAAAVRADRAAWSEYERRKLEYDAAMESWGLDYDARLLRVDAANARASAAGGGADWLKVTTDTLGALSGT